MVPISSKRRQRTNNESQAIISAKSNMIIEVVSSNSHNTQDVDNKTTISTPHPNQTPTISTKQFCSICNKNNARYKCPRCNISYCSVSCYQIHDGTSSTTTNNTSSNKCCDSSLIHLNNNNATNTNDDDNRLQQSVLSNMYNDININLDTLDYCDERITNLIQNDTKNVELVNGMIEEIKDNVCKSTRAMGVFRIDQLNNNSKFENGKDHTFGEEDKDMNQNRRVVNSMSTQLNKVEDVSSTKQDRIQEQDVKKDELSIDLLISGMNAMDSGNDTSDDRDMLSSGVLNLGLGNSNQRPLVVENEMVSISTI